LAQGQNSCTNATMTSTGIAIINATQAANSNENPKANQRLRRLLPTGSS
jgi:hypothetical protein